jgi:MscS family membrane protein
MDPQLVQSQPTESGLFTVLLEFLRQVGPLGLLWWQWVAVPGLVVLASLLGSVLSWFSRRLLKRFTSQNEGVWFEVLQARLKTPLTALWSVMLFSWSIHVLVSSAQQLAFFSELSGALITALLFWGVSRVVQSISSSAVVRDWTLRNPEFGALLPLMLRATRIGILFLAMIAIFSALGYPVASLVAGLGIGGLALALAAQKTGENLFASLAISLDHPFRVGDLIRIENGVMGFVDTIGLRSTRIRTLEHNTIVTIPNGKLSDMQIEIVSDHEKTQFHTVLTLVYQTTEAQLRQVIEGVEAALRGHEKVWPEEVIVRFKALGAYSLDLEVMAWFTTTHWLELKKIREAILFQCVQVVERSGTSFAFPTQTLHFTKV